MPLDDRDAYLLQEFLEKLVKGGLKTPYICIKSYTCVDGTVMTLDPPMDVLIVHCKAYEEPGFPKIWIGKCAICLEPTRKNPNAALLFPYCAKHGALYDKEWWRCRVEDCNTPTPVKIQTCAAHGGTDYKPRIKEV